MGSRRSSTAASHSRPISAPLPMCEMTWAIVHSEQ
jgi:hypothetical protein